MTHPMLGYLSGAPRVSTRPEAGEGGARAHVLGVIHGFEARGWDVRRFIVGDRMARVATGSAGSAHRAWPRRAGVDAARLTMGQLNSRRARRELGTDLTLVYERLASLQSLGATFQRRGVPWVLESNALLYEEARQRGSLALQRIARRIELASYRQCDAVVCVSEALRSQLVAAAGIGESKVIVLPNGVDTARFDPARAVPRRVYQEFTVGFVGSLYGWQRVDLLIDAVAALDAAGIPIRAVIVGDGPERAAWERRARERAPGLVHFAGRASWDEVPSWIAGFDAGFSGQDAATDGRAVYFSPLKLYEYLAMATPVVATASEDAARLIGAGGAGALFAPGDAADLRRALASAIARREELAAIGAVARAEIIARHSWDARVRQLLDQLGTVLGRDLERG